MKTISINYNELSDIRNKLHNINSLDNPSSNLIIKELIAQLDSLLLLEIPKRHIEYDDIIFSNFSCTSSHVIPLEVFWYEMVKLTQSNTKIKPNHISDYWDFYYSTESNYCQEQTINIQQLMVDIRNDNESSDTYARGFINKFNHFKIKYNIGNDITHVYCKARHNQDSC